MIKLFSKGSLIKDKRGVSYIEIVVCLIVMVLIAAFTIPTMLGFVKDVQSKAHVAEARTCYLAAQTIATEMFASGSKDADIVTSLVVTNTEFADLIGPETAEDATVSASVTGGKVTSVSLTKDGTKVTITPGGRAVTEKVSSGS